MGKKLMLAVALVALMAAPAFASVQNVKVGGDLKTTSVIRNSFDLGATSTGAETAQNVFLSQVGLNVQADLTDNVSTMLRLTNESLWGQYDAASANQSGVRLDTAYVTMKELLYSPLTVTVGRQPLAYGNQFLIGDGDGTTGVAAVSDLTGGANFDAIKAVLGYDAVTVDLFAAKISEDSIVAQNDSDDADLYGINAAFKLGDKMGSVVEAYTFAKMDKTAIVGNNTKTQKLYVPGLRVSTNPIEGLNFSLEGAYEKGNGAANKTTSAYGLQGSMTYALPVIKDMKPTLFLGYTYLSGDKNPGDGKNKSFDALYMNQNVGRIWTTLFVPSNMGVVQAWFEMVPVQDVTARLTWFNLNQVQKNDINITNEINNPFGVSKDEVSSTGKKALGNEIDLDLTYAYTEDVKFGLSGGYFFPGKAFMSDTKDAATQFLTSVAVAF